MLQTTSLIIASMLYTDTLAAQSEDLMHAKLRHAHLKEHVEDYARQNALDENVTLFDLREQGVFESLKAEALNLHQGQTIELLLAENPSTGFSWTLDKDSANGLWTAIEEHTAAPQTGRYPMMGAPGVKKITIQVDTAKQGNSMFRAVYVRPWMWHGWESFNEQDFAMGNGIF